jgi:hypothetical protein
MMAPVGIRSTVAAITVAAIAAVIAPTVPEVRSFTARCQGGHHHQSVHEYLLSRTEGRRDHADSSSHLVRVSQIVRMENLG